MNFKLLVELVLIEEKKTKKKKRKKLSKSKFSVPYNYWAPWGLPGWSVSGDGDTSDSGGEV
jgi:hypothetical protein